jgi:hypothetical protein
MAAGHNARTLDHGRLLSTRNITLPNSRFAASNLGEKSMIKDLI